MGSDNRMEFVFPTFMTGCVVVFVVGMTTLLAYNFWTDYYGDTLSPIGYILLGIICILAIWLVGIVVWYGIPIVSNRIEAWTGVYR